MGKRFLFLVDHKHRDLPGLSLMAFLLKEKGHKIFFCTLGDEDTYRKKFDPHIVVANKPVGINSRLLLCKAEGRKRIVVNTEGAVAKGGVLNIEVPPDLMFFWNEIEYGKYKDLENLTNTQKELVGSPRIDFLHPNFEVLYTPKKEFLKSLGLDSSKFTITIATHSVAAFHTEEYQKFKIKQLSEIFDGEVKYLAHLENCKFNLELTSKFLKTVVKNFPDVNFLLKPHPNENYEYWKGLIEKELNYPNLKITPGITVNQFLALSDFHVAHNGCTTTAEANLKGIPTCEFLAPKFKQVYQEDRMKMAIHKVSDLDSINEVLLKEISEKNKGKISYHIEKPEIKEYLFNNFFKSDGLRCFNHFLVLHNYASSLSESIDADYKMIKKIENQSKEKPFQYGLRYELGKIKAKILKTNKPENKSKENFKDWRKRYDNTIKPGDENFWFEKFEKAGFSISFFEELEKSPQN